jgi:hypothetical protein
MSFEACLWDRETWWERREAGPRRCPGESRTRTDRSEARALPVRSAHCQQDDALDRIAEGCSSGFAGLSLGGLVEGLRPAEGS